MTRRQLVGALALVWGVRAPLPAVSPHAELRGSSSLRFEANLGQWDPRVQFVAHANGGALLITDDAMVLTARTTAVTLKLVGVRPSAARGEEPLASRSNYFLGNDPSKWRSNVPNFARVRVPGWLPGVDVVWHGGQGGLEYDVEVAAGVDARQLEWAFDAPGEVAPDGSLHVGGVVQRPARVLQGGRELATRYERVDANRVRLEIEGYRPEEALLIDPVLAYSTYLGGSGTDSGVGIAVDTTGSVYVIGNTSSTDFPTTTAFQTTNAGNGDVFVTKLNAAGSAVVYSTYLGGSGVETAHGIAVDAAGDAYVTGITASTNFPTHAPLQAAYGGGTDDAFVAELNGAGSALVYSTYLGGSLYDEAYGVAVDTSGNAYVVGTTLSTNYPTQNAYQPAIKTICPNCEDVVVSKLNPSGSAFVYSTYLGGSGLDQGWAIAIGASGNAFVVGRTGSSDFPTVGSIQGWAGGATDAFVTELAPAGNALTYSTFVGGGAVDVATSVAVDPTGAAVVGGYTASNDFPTLGAVEPIKKVATSPTGFVTKVNAAGSALVYSTFLGGSALGQVWGVAADGAGDAYAVGYTNATNFVVVNPFQPNLAGGGDAFVSELNPSGSAFLYSTYLGGSASDTANAIAVDATGAAYVTGVTSSTDFPVVSAAQSALKGTGNAFVAKVTAPDLAAGSPCTEGACASGYCVDGFCCNTACADRCEACDVDGSVGTCTPVTGTPHASHPRCDDAGTTGVCAPICDGTDTKTCAYPGSGVVCGTVCKESAQTDTVCDGVGNCGGPGAYVVHSCDGLVCSADGGTCKPSCTSDTDCVSGYTCTGGTCVVGASCLDDHTAQAPYGPKQDCTPYKCAGGCRVACTSVDDCVAPNVCGTDGRCAPAQPTASSGGCGCALAGEPSSMTPALSALACLVLVLCRRRGEA